MTELVREHFRVFLKNANLDHKQYQEDGVVWCVNNETRSDPPYGVRGGLIADEMGLGKTITIIATIICNPKPNKKPTLVVLPCVLQNNGLKLYDNSQDKYLASIMEHLTKKV